MKHLLILTISSILLTAGCGGAVSNSAGNTAGNANSNTKSDAPPDLTVAPSETVNTLFAAALKGECTTVDEMLTEEMKKSVGTVDAYCSSLTGKGTVESASAVGASASSDTASVAVSIKYKAGAGPEGEPKPGDKKPAANTNTAANTETPADQPVVAAPQKTETKEIFLRKVGEKWLVEVTPKPAAPAKPAASPAKPA